MRRACVVGRRRERPALRRSLVAALIVVLAASGPAAGAAESLRLAFAGDAMLARGVTQALRRHGVDHPLGDLAPVLRAADLAFLNLECVLGRAGNPFMPTRVFYFRADAAAARTLQRAGVDFASLANNHAMDYRAEALASTRALLAGAGIAHAGAGPDLAAARAPAWLSAGGRRVAVLAFADHYREYAAGPASPGIHYLPHAGGEAALGPLREAIAAARAQGADLVVVSAHWGPNWDDAPSPPIVELAHALIEAGADLVHGHSAHVFQGVEFHRGGAVLYGTGALVDDYRLEPGHRNDLQGLFVVELDGRGVTGVELLPLALREAQVNLARGADRAAVIERARTLGAAFGTRLLERDGRVLLLPPEPRVAGEEAGRAGEPSGASAGAAAGRESRRARW